MELIVDKIVYLFTNVESLIVMLILYFLYFDRSKNINGFRYKKYLDSSNLNPESIIDGQTWSSTRIIKNRLSKKSNKDFFIGYFRYSPIVLKKCNIPFFYRKFNENTKIYINRIKMKKTTLVWGGMGSGKTVFFLNLLDQIDKYNNALVHDGGKLELVSKLYNPIRDIIFNPYDQRATIHDLLSEDTSLQSYFFELLLKSKSGEKINFFSTAAAEHLYNISLLANSKKFNTKKEKWQFFVNKIDELIENTFDLDQRSEKDVISTLKQVLKPLYLMNFRIQNDAETFTINQFLNKNGAAKLFVSYPPALKSKLQSMSSAFIALFTLVHLSRPDTNKRFHLYLIDELSSYLRMLNDTETLKDQLELLRSKGGMFVGGLQGDDEDDKYNQILDKTVNQKFYFRTDGIKTKQSLIKRVGKIRYRYASLTKSKNEIKSYNLVNAEIDVIKNDDFIELGERFEHIAIIDDVLYRGYTPLTFDEKEKLKRAESFVEYKKRTEFENYIAEKYSRFQQNKFKISDDIVNKSLN